MIDWSIMMSGITIKDVARECNLSVATVSRALGGSNHPVSENVRKLVEETANRMGYSPNILARGLKRNTTNEVAVFTPSVVNPFYASIIKGIEQKLWGTGYGMTIYITGLRGRSDAEVIQGVRGRMVAGVIAASDSVSETVFKELMKLKKEKSIPIVFADYQAKNDPVYSGVFCDYAQSTVQVADYLMNKGHRRIAFATTPLDRKSRIIRYQALKNHLEANGIPLNEENTFVCEAETSIRAGMELAGIVAQSPYQPTAVISINDMVAVGILSGFANKGIRVPDDISVVGFDDVAYAEVSYPPLTTVHIPAETIGEMAAWRFLNEIKGEVESFNVFMNTPIIERGSVRSLQ